MFATCFPDDVPSPWNYRGTTVNVEQRSPLFRVTRGRMAGRRTFGAIEKPCQWMMAFGLLALDVASGLVGDRALIRDILRKRLGGGNE